MPQTFMITWTLNGQTYEGLYECNDFHDAAKVGMEIAVGEGARLTAVDPCVDLIPLSGAPQIGIFWRITPNGASPFLLADSVDLADGETYGNFLNHGAHSDYWDRLAAMTTEDSAAIPDVARWTEYEDWPRGRVVYHLETERFVLYADTKLLIQHIVDEIMVRFSLPPDRTDIRTDDHYQTPL